MKLILNSRGLNTRVGTEQIFNAIKDYDLENKKIYLVSLPGYEVDDYIREACLRMGFKNENILFSSDEMQDEYTPDFVYVTEGNTFEILAYIRKHKIDKFIESVKDNLIAYIGSSAGAIISSKDVRCALDFDANYGLKNLEGLKLFDGTIIPHYDQEQLQRYIDNSDYEFINSYKVIYNVDNDNVLVLEAD